MVRTIQRYKQPSLPASYSTSFTIHSSNHLHSDQSCFSSKEEQKQISSSSHHFPTSKRKEVLQISFHNIAPKPVTNFLQHISFYPHLSTTVMVPSLHDKNSHAVQKSLKFKERDRKTRSFMQRLGLGSSVNQPAIAKQPQQQTVPPAIPSHTFNATQSHIPTYTAQQTRPALSSPRLMAAFGHSQNIGAPGQHPSNYPLHTINALEKAGVPLPGSDLVRKSFEIPTPNEGTSIVDDDVPKIRLNLSDVCCPLDLNPNPNLDRKANELESPPAIRMADPQPTSMDTSKCQLRNSSSQKHSNRFRRHRVSLSKKRASKFSISTGSTVSSSEFSLSVALAPPDCSNAASKVHGGHDLVSTYAVAHAHASGLGSPLAISTASLSVRGGMMRKAISTGDLGLIDKDLEFELDIKHHGHDSHMLSSTHSSRCVNESNLPFEDALLHTPSSRISWMEHQKCHDFDQTPKMMVNEMEKVDVTLNACNKRTSFKEFITTSHEMQANQNLVQAHDEVIYAKGQIPTSRNAQGEESPPIHAGTTTICNVMHGTGSRNTIKSVVSMAVAAAKASQNEREDPSTGIDTSQLPQTPRGTNLPKQAKRAKKRYQGSPPPKCEEIQSPIEAIPCTPLQFLSESTKGVGSAGKSRSTGTEFVLLSQRNANGPEKDEKMHPTVKERLRSMNKNNILSPKSETNLRQSSKIGPRTTNKEIPFTGIETNSQDASQRQAYPEGTFDGLQSESVKQERKPIKAQKQYAKKVETSSPLELNVVSVNSTTKSDSQDTTNKGENICRREIPTREEEEEEAKISPTIIKDKNRLINSNLDLNSIENLTQASNEVNEPSNKSSQASQKLQEDGIQWQIVNQVRSSNLQNILPIQTFAVHQMREDEETIASVSSRNNERKCTRRSYYVQRSTEEEETRKAVYSAFECGTKGEKNSARLKKSDHFSANERALDSDARLVTNKQRSSHNNENVNKEYQADFSEKGSTEIICRTDVRMQNFSHCIESIERQAFCSNSHPSQEESTIDQFDKNSLLRQNFESKLVPSKSQQILSNYKVGQTKVKQTQFQSEENVLSRRQAPDHGLEEFDSLQIDASFINKDLHYSQQQWNLLCSSSGNGDKGTSAKNVEGTNSNFLDNQVPQISAYNESNISKDLIHKDGLFSSRSAIHQWALDQNWEVESVKPREPNLFEQKMSSKLGRIGTEGAVETKPKRSMGKCIESQSELASVIDNAGKLFKHGKKDYEQECFDKLEYINNDTFVGCKDTKRPSSHSTPSQTRSLTLSSLYQSDKEIETRFNSIVKEGISSVDRRSISSIAPTLVTALASLPSDRFLDTDQNLSTNVNVSSLSLSSSSDEFAIPGAFENYRPRQTESSTMSRLQRSKSVQSLLPKREKKKDSSSLRSSHSSVSDTFKSACNEEMSQQQEQASSSRSTLTGWQEEIDSEADNVTSPRLLMKQAQKAQLRASHLIGHPSTPSTAQDLSFSRQTSFFDQMGVEHEEEEESFREAHRVHRRCSSDITSHNALLKGLGLRSGLVEARKEVLPPARPARRSAHASKNSETFLNDLGCWMEETEEIRSDVLNERKAIIEEIASCASLSSEHFETAFEDSRVRVNSNRRSVAPPIPPRRRPKSRGMADLDGIPTSAKILSSDASGSSDSWSRLNKVPMYVRLGHLPNRLIDAPSTMSWRSRIGQQEYNDLLQKFDQREMHRQEVIEELYVTEHNFIVQVASILRTFSDPLRFSDYAFHDSVPVEVARLFHDLDVILAVHVRMFKALDANIKAHPSSLIVSLADAIKPMIDSFAAYQSYLIRYDSVIKLLDSLSLTSEKGSLSWFAETMDKQASLDECKGLGFGSFLLKPVQRLMKYPLFFKQLDELMDGAHPDKNATTSLYRATERLIGNMNAVKAREEDFELIASLENRISGLPEGHFLANRQRKLIKQGEIRCVRLTEMERLSLLERSKWESPNLNGQSPLLNCFDSQKHSNLRRLSLLGSSPGSSPALLENEPGFESGSASGCSTSSNTASTPSAGSNLTISSTMTSPALSSTYFDFKVSDEVNDKDATELQSGIQVPKRKSVAGFLLRGNNATQTPPLPSIEFGNKSMNKVHEEEELYIFVFDDICVLTKRDARSLKVKKKGSAPIQNKRGPNNLKEDLDTYTALGYIGMSKILSVQQWKNSLMGHSDLLEVEVMPVKTEFGSKNNLTGTITFYFEFDPATNQGGQWHQAFERSFCTSIQVRKERSTGTSVSAKEMDKILNAQLEWRRREKHITEVVNNAALAVDRKNLAALLQAGLPFPRSPSQQNLADLAFRTAAKVESSGLDVEKKKENFIDRQRASSNGQTSSISPTSPNPTRPSLSRLRHVNSNPSLRQSSQAAAISASRQIDVEGIPRIGDMNAMCGGVGKASAISWEQDRQEERKWWRIRLREVERESERQEEVDKMVESRRSRVSMPSPHALHVAAFDQAYPSPNRLSNPLNNNNVNGFDKSVENATMDALHFATPSPARTIRTNKVRKGLPILKIN